MLKILVVDDSETVRLKIAQLLKQLGHKVLEAENGVVALEVLNGNPDLELCICDINMPEMDGLTFVEEVRKKSDKTKDLTFFMCTTETSKAHRDKAKSLGVRGWIHKPYKDSQIIHLVEFMVKELLGDTA
ncbi:MAG: response regulator [Bdellovibrionota bacterium]|nr:response regulator [Bdellovibrionota bacterium]